MCVEIACTRGSAEAAPATVDTKRVHAVEGARARVQNVNLYVSTGVANCIILMTDGDGRDAACSLFSEQSRARARVFFAPHTHSLAVHRNRREIYSKYNIRQFKYNPVASRRKSAHVCACAQRGTVRGKLTGRT